MDDDSSQSSFWIVSVQGDPTPKVSLQKVVETCRDLSAISNFPVPELKIGTMDTLVSISDQLQKLDPFIENVVCKLAQYIAEIIRNSAGASRDDKLPEGLHDALYVGSGSARLTVGEYLRKFQWEVARFPLKQPLPVIVDSISKLVTQIEADYKQKASTYNGICQNIQAFEKKVSGTLLVRSLASLVKPEHIIHDSEYLQTLLVIVPRNSIKDWYNNYEHFNQYVVPRSSDTITEDPEYYLVTVTVMKKIVEEFKQKARESKFIVRDFEFDPKGADKENKEKDTLLAQRSKQQGPLLVWLKANYNLAFTAWIHVKALRVFVESVLRYGIPVNFASFVMVHRPKADKRVHDNLCSTFGHVDDKYLEAEAVDIPAGLGFTQSDYRPYVFFPVNLNLLEK
ncbi:hypothetical protein EMCRGX_G023659 [Ephydatia muelleri]